MRRLSRGFVLLALLFVPTKVGAGMGGDGLKYPLKADGLTQGKSPCLIGRCRNEKHYNHA